MIDGFPKTVEEAKGLEDAGYGFSKAIFLDVSDEVATERNEGENVAEALAAYRD